MLRGLVLIIASLGEAQTLIRAADIPVAESYLSRVPDGRGFGCEFSPILPMISVSQRYLAGYSVVVHSPGPSLNGRILTTVLKITPVGHPPVYLSRRLEATQVSGRFVNGGIDGGFFLGRGKYGVDAAIYDDLGHSCQGHWGISVDSARPKGRASAAEPYTVEDLSLSGLSGIREGTPLGQITLFIHAAPLNISGSRITPTDRLLLTSAVSGVLEKIAVRRVRLIVFSLEGRKELYRSSDFQFGDIDRVSDALLELHPAAVGVNLLRDRDGDGAFLTKLTNDELGQPQASSVVVFLGPRGVTNDAQGKSARRLVHNTPTRFYFIDLTRSKISRSVGQTSESAIRTPHSRAFDRAAGPPDPIGSLPVDSVSTFGVLIDRVVSRERGRTFRVGGPSEFMRAIATIRAEAER